jgi:hypothetical protein
VSNRTKIAILGFTSHRNLCPWDDDGWELWALNDLYVDMPQIFQRKPVPVERLRWFQMHPWANLAHWVEPKEADMMNQSVGPPHPRDPNHIQWLAEAAKHFPVYLREAREEIPGGIRYPREEVFKYFKFKYFTNSITWMIALAIMELCPKPGTRAKKGSAIGVWGVDMMMAGGAGSEYGYQRPSCEWLLGWAQAAGIDVHIPDESDLLKSSFQYGDYEGQYARRRIEAYMNDLRQRIGIFANQERTSVIGGAECRGAVNALEWFRRGHMPGDEGSEGGQAPIENAHNVIEVAKPKEG